MIKGISHITLVCRDLEKSARLFFEPFGEPTRINEKVAFCEQKIQSLGLDRGPTRTRDPQEGLSLYFYDYDNHLFELHTGDLSTRLQHYFH